MNLRSICKILKECHALGVSEFTLNGMSFKFYPRSNEVTVLPGQGLQELHISTALTPADEQDIKQFDEQAQEDAEEMQLMVDDPAAYEKAQMDRFLEQARVNGEAQSRTTESRV